MAEFLVFAQSVCAPTISLIYLFTLTLIHHLIILVQCFKRLLTQGERQLRCCVRQQLTWWAQMKPLGSKVVCSGKSPLLLPQSSNHGHSATRCGCPRLPGQAVNQGLMSCPHRQAVIPSIPVGSLCLLEFWGSLSSVAKSQWNPARPLISAVSSLYTAAMRTANALSHSCTGTRGIPASQLWKEK